jgi:hypothetical protein
MHNIPSEDLPVVFEEAISLCHQFKIPFIWIDSLCIIQPDEPGDDTLDWQEQCPKMAEYYSNAFLTISATSSGKPTIPFLRNERESMFATHAFPVYGSQGKEETTIYARMSSISRSNRPFSDVRHYGPLTNRAWAWQEAALSTRNLHFCRSQLWWECKTHFVPETMVDGGMEERFGLAKTLRLAEDNPISCWMELVGEYNKRSLTRPTDRLPAISGAATKIQRFIGGDYHAGIWAKYLLPSSCWYSTLSQLVFRDRWHEIKGVGSDYIAPSWSWASVRGEIKHFITPGQEEFVSSVIINGISPEVLPLKQFGKVTSGCLNVTRDVIRGKIVWKIKPLGASARVNIDYSPLVFNYNYALILDCSFRRRARDLDVDKIKDFKSNTLFLVIRYSGSDFYLIVLKYSLWPNGSYP